MICIQCGSFIEEGQMTCGKCGMVLHQPTSQQQYQQPHYAGQQPQPQQWQQPQMNPQYQQQWQQPYGMGVQRTLSKKEFYKHPNMLSVKKEINLCGICLYICAVISLGIGLLTNLSVLIDVCFIVGMGLGIQLGRSRVCSILLAIYSGINVIVTTVMTGRFGGYWIVLIAVYSIISTFKFHKLYREYLNTGVIPVIPEKGKKAGK